MFRPVTRAEVWFDIAGGVAYALIFAIAGNRLGDTATMLLGLAFAIPLALRRVSPLLALILAWMAAALQMFALQSPHLADAAILVVLYSTARYGTRLVRYLGLVSSIVGAVVASVYTLLLGALIDIILLSLPELLAGAILALFGAVAAFAVLGLSWAAGLLVRTRALAAESRIAEAIAHQEQERSEQALALLEERHRIARDMHDVVAHSLAVVIAQADGARYVASTKPELATEALVTISDTARAALADVRILLGQLRHHEGESPQPDLADLDRLLDQLRASGLRLDVTDTIDRTLVSPAGQLVTYRIIQESLTNALRHGSNRVATTVQLGTDTGALRLVVTNPIEPVSVTATAETTDTGRFRSGHGLSGMTERAALAGGTVTVSSPPGVFRVEASIPLTAIEGSR